ncbi:UNVERIFIED_CONTAM: Metacaspase-2 [Sesamum radiatum]|uniref:Metacaspase-2 n=1 Tax=Sesamum radiatum TaxID=300843 RepID=A0AAW2RWB3_SESRA
MDEVDGYDEMLWPVDHKTEGTILDDEINATIVRPLPQGARLHAIVDACHSGTILDLPFVCRMDRDGNYKWENHGRQSAIYKGTSGGLAVSLSACDDHQVSVDTTALSGNAATGAMTYSFIRAAQNEPGLTYGRLLNAMRQTIRDTKTGHLMIQLHLS